MADSVIKGSQEFGKFYRYLVGTVATGKPVKPLLNETFFSHPAIHPDIQEFTRNLTSGIDSELTRAGECFRERLKASELSTQPGDVLKQLLSESNVRFSPEEIGRFQKDCNLEVMDNGVPVIRVPKALLEHISPSAEASLISHRQHPFVLLPHGLEEGFYGSRWKNHEFQHLVHQHGVSAKVLENTQSGDLMAKTFPMRRDELASQIIGNRSGKLRFYDPIVVALHNNTASRQALSVGYEDFGEYMKMHKEMEGLLGETNGLLSAQSHFSKNDHLLGTLSSRNFDEMTEHIGAINSATRQAARDAGRTTRPPPLG